MVGSTSQAEPVGYGMSYEKKYGYDKPYTDKPKYPSYKPDHKSTNDAEIKKLKCNNVNLNVNDASVNVGRLPVGDFTSLDTTSSSSSDETGIQEGITTANAFANGERYNNNNGFKKDKDGFVYVCINNNNNAGQGGEEPEPLTCEECFTTVLDDTQLMNLQQFLSIEYGNLEGLCEVLSNPDVSNESKLFALSYSLGRFANADSDQIDKILECLERIGFIVRSTS
jgi:hypothetical protein